MTKYSRLTISDMESLNIGDKVYDLHEYDGIIEEQEYTLVRIDRDVKYPSFFGKEHKIVLTFQHSCTGHTVPVTEEHINNFLCKV